MITIDSTKCTGCGSCLNKCPRGLLTSENGKAVYNRTSGCLGCLHCVAACPAYAITVTDGPSLEAEEISPLPADLDQKLTDLFWQRRSYRDFSGELVPLEELESALKLSYLAPSAKNAHVTEYHIIRGKEKMDGMMSIIEAYIKETGYFSEILDDLAGGRNSVFTTANTVILTSAVNNKFAMADAAIAMTYAELILQSRGIGTCWAGYFASLMNMCPKLREYLGFPEEKRTFYTALLVGYPQENYLHIPVQAQPMKITVL